jgi:hypothetical protein
MKKHYRIYLYESNNITEKITLLAAKSNAGEYISIGQLVIAFDYDLKQFPILNFGFVAEVVGDNKLCIDKRLPDGSYKNVLYLEEVEIMVLEDVEC